MAGKEISGPAFFVGVVVGLPSYMTEPFRKSGLRFRILPFAYGLLLMQNSHLTVFKQATKLSLAQSESAKALQGHTADNVGVSLLLFQYEDCKKNFRPFRTPCIIFVMPPRPDGGQ